MPAPDKTRIAFRNCAFSASTTLTNGTGDTVVTARGATEKIAREVLDASVEEKRKTGWTIK